MTNKPKQTGTAFEAAVTRYLRANGFPLAERRALAGNLDRGDILVCPGIIAECKAWATFSDNQVMAWLGETQREQVNANADIGLLIIKRQYHGDAKMGLNWCVRMRNGYITFQWLAEAVLELRDHGYGNPP